jgi:dUTP pyrophosphatase
MLKIDMVFEQGCHPEKAHITDAGFDLRSNAQDFTIEPGAKRMIGTGVRMDIPEGFVGIIAPRSGLGSKFEIVLANTVGVIDAHYTGEIKLAMVNKGKVKLEIAKFDRIAQLLLLPVPEVQFTIVKELKESDRGEKGHGSSGNA